MENQSIYLFVIGIIIWLAGLSFFLYQAVSHYNNLVKLTGKNNITQILEEILNKLEEEKKSLVGLELALNNLKLDSVHHIQKVGLLRFNPFEDTGGDQSFILALIDGNNTGIILTSLHNRGVTRWYTKGVEKGKGVDFQLSEEEEKAIKQAIAVHTNKNKNLLTQSKKEV